MDVLSMMQSLFSSIFNTEVVENYTKYKICFESLKSEQYWRSYPHSKTLSFHVLGA